MNAAWETRNGRTVVIEQQPDGGGYLTRIYGQARVDAGMSSTTYSEEGS